MGAAHAGDDDVCGTVSSRALRSRVRRILLWTFSSFAIGLLIAAIVAGACITLASPGEAPTAQWGTLDFGSRATPRGHVIRGTTRNLPGSTVIQGSVASVVEGGQLLPAAEALRRMRLQAPDLPSWALRKVQASLAKEPNMPVTIVTGGWPWHGLAAVTRSHCRPGVAPVGVDLLVRGDSRLPRVRPLWFGLVLDGIFYGAGIGTLAVLVRSGRRRIRRYQQRCEHCGYNLAGISSAHVCPECGASSKSGLT